MSIRYIGNSALSSVELFRRHGITPFRNILTTKFFNSLPVRKMRSSTVLIPEVVFWLMATVALTEGAMAAAVISFWASLRGTFTYLPLRPKKYRGRFPLFGDLILNFFLV